MLVAAVSLLFRLTAEVLKLLISSAHAMDVDCEANKQNQKAPRQALG